MSDSLLQMMKTEPALPTKRQAPMNERRQVKGVLFDLDNTLHNRDRSFLNWTKWFVRQRLGIQQGDDFEEAVRLLVELDANGSGAKEAFFQRIRELYPNLEDELASLVNSYPEQHVAHINPIESATLEVLNAIQSKGLVWGIVTNGSRNQFRKLQKLGLEGLADCVIVSEVLGTRKPDPEAFLVAAEQLQLNAEEILFVGDDPERDIVGAAEVGMKTAWIRRGRQWPATITDICPDYTIDDLSEIIHILKSQG